MKDIDSCSAVTRRIEAFNRGLLPESVAIKYRLMAESPYRFFGGTCHLFFEDLYGAPRCPLHHRHGCRGDLHVENLGSYKGNNRLVYFDLNDFDKAVLGPAIWELAAV